MPVAMPSVVMSRASVSMQKHAVSGQRVPTARAARVMPKSAKLVRASAEEEKPLMNNLINPTRRQMVAGTMGAFASSCACSTCGTGPALADGVAFTYGQYDGALKWQGTCSLGDAQSPINISPANADMRVAGRMDTFQFNYKNPGVAIVNTGKGIQVNYAPGNYVTLGDRKMQLLQFHFHTPSEHTREGKHSQMEVHLVHRDVERQNLCVLGALLSTKKQGSAKEEGCAGLEMALDEAPDTPNMLVDKNMPVDLMSFLPSDKGYYNYNGSLTTPPCSEGVDWYVFAEPVKISAQQALEFQQMVGQNTALAFNYRPTQPLGDRSLTRMVEVRDWNW